MAILCGCCSLDLWCIFDCLSLLLRHKGIPVIISSITPRIIKKLPNYTTIYGYNVEYILNGERYIAKSVEFYITVLVPGPMVPYSLTGKLTKTVE